MTATRRYFVLTLEIKIILYFNSRVFLIQYYFIYIIMKVCPVGHVVHAFKHLGGRDKQISWVLGQSVVQIEFQDSQG